MIIRTVGMRAVTMRLARIVTGTHFQTGGVLRGRRMMVMSIVGVGMDDARVPLEVDGATHVLQAHMQRHGHPMEGYEEPGNKYADSTHHEKIVANADA
jgi:hypothetical protein